MQKTFRDAGMIGGHFRDAKDELLSEYLVEFLTAFDESKEFQPQKNRKRELKSQLEVQLKVKRNASPRWSWSLCCPMRDSDHIAIGNTHSTLQPDVGDRMSMLVTSFVMLAPDANVKS